MVRQRDFDGLKDSLRMLREDYWKLDSKMSKSNMLLSMLLEELGLEIYYDMVYAPPALGEHTTGPKIRKKQ